MKTKNIMKVLVMAMLMPAMLFTACSKDKEVTPTIDDNTAKNGYELQVTVNVTRQSDDDTPAGSSKTMRVHYNEGTKKLEFSEGDKLFVTGMDGGYGKFAGTLTWQSEGTFRGTIYTQNEYLGTANELFTAANSNWVEATLFPAGYESYQFLSISGSGYGTSYGMDYNKAIAATKAEAVEQLSLEQAQTYSSGFALSPQNAILNFTITDLTDGEKAVTLKDGARTMFSGSVTPTSGTATFALGAMIYYNYVPVNLNNVTLTIGSTEIDITDANKYLAAGKIMDKW